MIALQGGTIIRTANIIVAATGSWLLCAVANGAPPKLPAMVSSELGAIAAECTGVGGKPQTGDAVRRADLNGDGRDDYVLDVGSIVCDGAPGIYGDRQKGVTVYVGDGAGGARNAFSAWAYGARLEGTGTTTRLWLTVSGRECGRKPAAHFASESFCDRYVQWNASTQRFDFAPVSTVKMVQ